MIAKVQKQISIMKVNFASHASLCAKILVRVTDNECLNAANGGHFSLLLHISNGIKEARINANKSII